METQWVDFEQLRRFDLAEGVDARPLFGEGAMLNLIEFEPSASVPPHRHSNEQLGIVLRGRLTMTIGGDARELRPMQAYAIPGGVEHSGDASTEGALVLDVFRPVREDYREAWSAADG